MDLHTLPDRIVLALLIWGESRGEPVEGQIAVANVVRNRLKRAVNTTPRWRDVCLAPAQFSCFDANDPNAAAIQNAAALLTTATLTPALEQAQWIADGMIIGACQDNTRGSNHYITKQLYQTNPPSWATNPICQIGSQVFFIAA